MTLREDSKCHSILRYATKSAISRGESASPRGCFSFWNTSSSDRARPSCKKESRLLTPCSEGGLNSRFPTSSLTPTSYLPGEVYSGETWHVWHFRSWKTSRP